MRYILIALIVLAAILLIIALAEPHFPEFTSAYLKKAKPRGENFFRDKENPYGTTFSNADFKAYFISDLHAEFCFVPAKKICEEIAKAQPDCVIFGGDIITWTPFKNRGIKYLKQIADTCESLGIPFLGVTGNHDTDLSEDDIKACGFVNLENTYFEFDCASGKKYVITGVDDSGRKDRQWYQMAPLPDCDAKILVAHNPDALIHLEDNFPDFMLSGHIHGGQVRTPIKIEFTVLRDDELPKLGVIAGCYEYKNTSFFISRGLGCVDLPIRLGARPEAGPVFFRLKE